jgi:MarR family transcriptional regulator, organic hydroperoxide resistance regulator
MPDNVNPDIAISETMQSLRRIFKAIQDYSHEVYGRFGITGPQLWALTTISRKTSLPLGELSKEMYLHPSTISGVIDRLENKGYVVRDRNCEDRRIVNVRLTPAGKSVVKKAPNPAQGKMIHGLRKLKEKDLNNIYHSVQKLVEIMEAQDLHVTFFFDQEQGVSE